MTDIRVLNSIFVVLLYILCVIFDFQIQNANLNTTTEAKIHTNRHSLSEKLFLHRIYFVSHVCNLFPHVIQALSVLVDRISKQFLFSGHIVFVSTSQRVKLFSKNHTGVVWMYFPLETHKYMELNSFWCIIFILNFFRFGVSDKCLRNSYYITYLYKFGCNVISKHLFQFDLVLIIAESKLLIVISQLRLRGWHCQRHIIKREMIAKPMW